MQRAGARSDEPADELPKHDAHEDDDDRGDDARDVADQLPELTRERFEAQRVRGHENHGEHHEPEYEIADHARWIDLRARSLHRFHHTSALEHRVQSHTTEESVDDSLEHLGQEISGEDDDQRAEKLWNQIAENLTEARPETIDEGQFGGVLLKHFSLPVRGAVLGACSAFTIEDDASATCGTEQPLTTPGVAEAERSTADVAHG